MAEHDSTSDVASGPAELDASKEGENSEWVLVYDAENERDYYFNLETQESRWEVPEGSRFAFPRVCGV